MKPLDITLPLWIVKYGGSAIAIVAEDTRANACAAAKSKLISPVAIGDMTAALIGTGPVGKRGIIAEIRQQEYSLNPPRKADIKGNRQGLGLALSKIHTGPDRNLSAPAFLAACNSVGMTVDEVRTSRDPAAVDARHAFWTAAHEAGILPRASSEVSATHESTVRNYIRDGGRQGPEFADALAAARKVLKPLADRLATC